MAKKLLVILSMTIFLSNCDTRKNKILFDNFSFSDITPKHLVIIDNKDTILINGNTDSFMTSKSSLKIQVDGGKPQQIFFGIKGGTVNLNKNEYVILDINYEGNEAFKGNETFESKKYAYGKITVLLIDSFLIWEKKNVHENEMFLIKDHFKELISSSDGRIVISKPDSLTKGYFCVYDYTNFELVPKDSFFISKTWDYESLDQIQDSLFVKSKSFDLVRKRTERKKLILNKTLFLVFAMLNPSIYKVVKTKDLLN